MLNSAATGRTNSRGAGSSRGRTRDVAVASVHAVLLLLAMQRVHAAAPGTGTPDSGAPTDTLEAITVTAEFRREDLQHTPVSITAISAESMEAHGDNNIADVASRAPSVTLTASSAAFGNSVSASIRGVGQYDPSFALEPGVGIYVDDVYQGTLFGSMLDLLDLQRVEVLRGPQGILAGKNSIGGAIKLFSQPPTEEGGYVQAEYGSYNRVNIKAAASFAIVPDKLLVRFSAVSKNADGYFTDYDYACTHPGSGVPTARTGTGCQLGTEGGQSLGGARMFVRWMPTDAITDDLIATRIDDNSETAPTKLIYASNPGVAANGVPYDGRFLTGARSYSSYASYCGTPSDGASFCVPRQNTLQAWEFSNSLNLQVSEGLSFKSITGVQGDRGSSGYDPDGSPLDVELSNNEYATHQFTQELQLNGKLAGDMIEWTLGGFYFHSHDITGGRDDLDFSGLDFLSDDAALTRSASAFANVRWNVSDKLSLSAGERYTNDRKDYTFDRYNPDGTSIACGEPSCTVNSNWQLYGLSGQVGRYSGSHDDYRVAVDYQWTPYLMTYGDVSTGYKGGGVNPRPFFPSQIVAFSPETLTSYEVGVKSDWFEHRARMNLAAFYSRYKDIQQNITVCNQDSPYPGAPCLMPVNAGDADIKGVELEAQAQVTHELSIDGSMSFTNFDYTSVNPATGIEKGMITTYTPKFKSAAAINYKIPLGAAGTLTPQVDWTYQSTIYTNSAVNTAYNRVASYGIANVHLLYADAADRWEGSIALTNAFDKFYYLSKIDTSPVEQGGYVNGRPGAPRMWLLSVKRKF
jgi:iron complex outermembrane receptor protein